ncbi:hypothetical protein FBY12_2801 [Pseudomonas sp. SJZ131]|nr:hypothetical protein FBY12_2801 [Pseudomonas sp. SJZ131]
MAVCQSHLHRLTHRFASKLSSHRFCVWHKPRVHSKSLWERACSRWRCISHQLHHLTHRFASKLSSHRFCARHKPRIHNKSLWE